MRDRADLDDTSETCSLLADLAVRSSTRRLEGRRRSRGARRYIVERRRERAHLVLGLHPDVASRSPRRTRLASRMRRARGRAGHPPGDERDSPRRGGARRAARATPSSSGRAADPNASSWVISAHRPASAIGQPLVDPDDGLPRWRRWPGPARCGAQPAGRPRPSSRSPGDPPRSPRCPAPSVPCSPARIRNAWPLAPQARPRSRTIRSTRWRRQVCGHDGEPTCPHRHVEQQAFATGDGGHPESGDGTGSGRCVGRTGGERMAPTDFPSSEGRAWRAGRSRSGR